MNDVLKTTNFSFKPQNIPWQEGLDLYMLWKKACPPNRFPALKDLDLMAMDSLLPFMCLYHVQRKPLEFQMNYIGHEIVNITGLMPASSRYKVPGSDLSHVRFNKMLELEKPYIASNIPMVWPHKIYQYYDSIALPFHDENETITDFVTLAHLHA